MDRIRGSQAETHVLTTLKLHPTSPDTRLAFQVTFAVLYHFNMLLFME